VKCIVTGGSGFLGKALAKALAREGHEVTTLQRSVVHEFNQSFVFGQIKQISCDLGSDQDLTPLLSGAEAIFHVAAKVGLWGKRADFYRDNVLATDRLLAAAQKAGVRYFIYTSSPSVVAGSGDLLGVDESTPYPKHFHAAYSETKAIAEQKVLAAHQPQFTTISLRPHLIFGRSDTNLIPLVVARARAGRLPIIGAGRNMVDFTYIDDCVAAHLCALTTLQRSPDRGGKPYFISQGEPYPLWGWIQEVVRRSGLPPLTRHLPTWLAYGVASMCEGAVKLVPALGAPLLTRLLVEEMTTSHYFNINAARKNLGYAPRYTVAQALEATFS
jgi:2-alkyl-3-oxoalkanoate reductase